MNRVPEQAILYLSAIRSAHVSEAIRIAEECDVEWDRVRKDLVFCRCEATLLRNVCLKWSEALARGQQESIRCYVADAGSEPSCGDLMYSESLSQLVDFVEGQWLDDVLQSERLVTYFQPIVNNRNPREVFAHECLVRGVEEDGNLITPVKLFAAARACDRVARLDHASRIAAIETSVQKSLSSWIFINFNPRYLDDSYPYLQETMQAVRESQIAPGRFVFEVVESDEIEDVGRLHEIVEECRSAGCQVALDDLGTGYNSLYLMTAIKPDFIKLDRTLVRDVESDIYKSRVAGKLVELARELNIKTVVEGIETAEAWRWAVEQGAEYGQGFLFARPHPEPIDFCTAESDVALLELPEISQSPIEQPS